MKTKISLLVISIASFFYAHSQVIISQYYEGTGTNKWIELTNLGTSSVNTASPQLKLGLWNVGGSTGNIAFTGNPTATMNLNVVIPAKGSVLIGNTGNGNEVSYLTALSASQTNNTVINFNGNDGIALLNSTNVVIDRFGTGINATDISYVRATNITTPSATFVSSQWTSVSIANVSSAVATSANRLGFHIPNTPNCVTPSIATALNLTATTNSITGTFNAVAGNPNYLIVQSLNSTLTSLPVNGTTYALGSSLGGGTIISNNATTSFTANSLNAATTYYYFVFTVAVNCTGQPFYSNSLAGNITTLNNTGGAGSYYNAAVGLTCQPLKTALKNIISTGYNTLSYTPGIWNLFYYSDKRLNDAGTATIVWDMYSDNPLGAEPYTYTLGTNQCGTYSGESNCYNREHSTPQSWFNNASPMVSDAHHIFATDGYVNAIRSNFPYGEVSNATQTSLNGSKLGTGTTNFGYTGTVFEPRNEYKGDFARACLYMAVRYEDQIISQNWSSFGTANEVFLSATNQTDPVKRRLLIYDPWFLQLMIQWHNQDPVSQKEIDRNNIIHHQSVVNATGGTLVKQNNRNPFIDHPEYVAAIWGNGDGTACGTARSVTTKAKDAFIQVDVFPNPAAQIITVTTDQPILSIEIGNAFGTNSFLKKMNDKKSNTLQIDVSSFINGSYIIKVVTAKGVITKQFKKI